MTAPDPTRGCAGPTILRHLMRQLLCPRLIGRDEELTAISLALTAAQQGRGQVLFLLGEAGVGKSRLSVETEKLAVSAGMRTLRGHCVEAGQSLGGGSASALRPIAEALLAARRRDSATG